MLDVLKNYLTGAATPELQLALENAHAALEASGMEDYERGFEELLMLEDTVDAGETLNGIVTLTRAALVQILTQHGVVFQENVGIEFLTQIVNGLFALPDCENKEELHQTASLEGTPEEVFAELMVFVTSETADQILCDLVAVEQGLIDRIRAMMAEDETALVQHEEVRYQEQLIDKLIKFCHFIGTEELRIIELLSSGAQVGLPFYIYLQALGAEAIEAMEDEALSHELMAAALISSDGNENVRARINAHLENFISDLDRITRLDILVSDLVLGLER